jgi:hypothetical protein
MVRDHKPTGGNSVLAGFANILYNKFAVERAHLKASESMPPHWILGFLQAVAVQLALSKTHQL